MLKSFRTYKTFNEYREAWDDAFVTDPPVPLNIDIELASLCNLACPFCFYGEADWLRSMREPSHDGKPKKRFMRTHLALRIITEAAYIGVPALKFNWRGESTMHPDYSLILRHARSYKFHDLLVNTNANCKMEAYDGLMQATKVMVSLDSLVPETYKKMRVNGHLETAITTVKHLLKYGHNNVWVRRVITKDNKDEPFSQMALDTFGDRVHVSEHMCFNRNENEDHQDSGEGILERTYCGYPSQRIMIAADGMCYPCCVDYDGTMPIGNIHKNSIMDIWDGPLMKALRRDLRANVTASKTCQNCTSYMAYKSKKRYFVTDREALNGNKK